MPGIADEEKQPHVTTAVNSIAARMVTRGFSDASRLTVTLLSFTSQTPLLADDIELGEFLRNGKGPEQQALLRLIGSLVEVPPFARDPNGEK